MSGASRNTLYLVLTILLIVYMALLWRTAWLGDDAFIAFRAADNFIHGYGPRWNVAERVQVFTSPLWTFVVAGVFACTREIWATTLALSAVVSFAAVGLLTWRHRTWSGAVALAALSMSRGFTDYSTSGLENPLLHLLLVLHIGSFGLAAGPRRAWSACLTAGLLGATRDDILLLVGPTALVALMGMPRRQAARILALGLAPFWIWKVFAVIYFGFPFPNTAYAKLATGIPAGDILRQGLHYFANSARCDPITLASIAGGIAIGSRAREAWQRAAAVGIALYLLYILRIGGDFMSGRFLAAPLLVAAILFIQAARSLPSRFHQVLVAGILIYGIAFPRSPLRASVECRSRAVEEVRDQHEISDERAFYHAHTNPACRTPGKPMPSFVGAVWGRELRMRGAFGLQATRVVGMRAFYGGPNLHLIEGFGLEDPLIARLPVPPDEPWMIGHFPRAIPAGYLETLGLGGNRITDLGIRAYYEKLCLITRGPLFTSARWQAILDLNLGRCDSLLAHVPSRTKSRTR